MIGSSGNSMRNCAEICVGDHSSASSQDSTCARSRGHRASLATFGRRARSLARRCARQPRYLLRPPLAWTSREIVEGARPTRPAMARNDRPASRPERISSRSVADNLADDGSHSIRRATPPASLITRYTHRVDLATSRATSTARIPSATSPMIRLRSWRVSFGYRPLFALPTTYLPIEPNRHRLVDALQRWSEPARQLLDQNGGEAVSPRCCGGAQA